MVALLLSSVASSRATSTTLIASTAADLRLSGGATVTANPLNSLRSGAPGQHTAAAFTVPLLGGVTLTGVSFSYRFSTGFGDTALANCSNFSLVVAGKTVYTSPHLTGHDYSSRHPNYSAPVLVTEPNLSLQVAGANPAISLVFDNQQRNVQLLLPLKV